MTKKRDILHIVVEDSDNWKPTTADMEVISELFQTAVQDEKGSIIVTRTGITAKIISVEEGVEVKVTRASIDQDAVRQITVGADEGAKPSCEDAHIIFTDEDTQEIAIHRSLAQGIEVISALTPPIMVKGRDFVNVSFLASPDWSPNMRDMTEISEQFADLVKSDDPAVLTTRTGITGKITRIYAINNTYTINVSVVYADVMKQLQ